MHGYKLCNRESVPKIIITPNFIFNTARAGFKAGQTGQLPRASTTRGAPKNSKTITTYGNIKILFETDNLE